MDAGLLPRDLSVEYIQDFLTLIAEGDRKGDNDAKWLAISESEGLVGFTFLGPHHATQRRQ